MGISSLVNENCPTDLLPRFAASERATNGCNTLLLALHSLLFIQYSIPARSNPMYKEETMTDEELKTKIKEVLAETGVWSGHREVTLEEVAVIQPGLARIMP